MIRIQNVVVSKTLCGVDIRRPSSPYSPLAEGATSCSWAFCQHTDTTSDCNNINKGKENKLIQRGEPPAKKSLLGENCLEGGEVLAFYPHQFAFVTISLLSS